jgi:hypothetical protein
VTAQPNIVVTSVVSCGTAAACRGNVNKGAMVPLEHESGGWLALGTALAMSRFILYLEFETSGLTQSSWQH